MRQHNIDLNLSLVDKEAVMYGKIAQLCCAEHSLHDGQSLFEHVRQKGGADCGRTLATITAFYNLVTTMSPERMRHVLDVHFQYVNPSLLSVKASFYGQLAELPHEFLLCRMVLLVRQYLSSLAELEKLAR